MHRISESSVVFEIMGWLFIKLGYSVLSGYFPYNSTVYATFWERKKYRVFDPYVPDSRIKWNWPHSEMFKSRTCHPQKYRVQNLPALNSPELGTLTCFEGGKSWTLTFLGVVSPGLCYFRGLPVQDYVFFWILA